MTQQTFMTQLILIWNMTHIRLTHCQSSSIPIYPIVHMMSHIILLFLKCSGTFFQVCNISFMAALHSHQCCVSSLLMLRFMTHIAHNDVRTTSSLHHSFSHYETAFLYIRASLAHVLDSQFTSYILWLYFSFRQVQSKLDLSDYNIRVCYILNLRSHITRDFRLYHHHVIGPQGKIFTLETNSHITTLAYLGYALSRMYSEQVGG